MRCPSSTVWRRKGGARMCTNCTVRALRPGHTGKETFGIWAAPQVLDTQVATGEPRWRTNATSTASGS